MLFMSKNLRIQIAQLNPLAEDINGNLELVHMA